MILKISQQTPEWLNERCGKVTGSRVKDVMARLKKGDPSKKRENYMMEIVSERLTGMAAEHYVSDAMVWGVEQEPMARNAYEVASGNDVDRAGIAIHPNIPMFAASPDGTIDKDGLFEAKGPMSHNHIKWMLAGVVPDEHIDQCQSQMACWEREWLDFVSFDSRMGPVAQLYRAPRLYRDEKRIAAIEFAVIEFLAEVDAMVEKIEKVCGPPETNQLKETLRRAVKLDESALGITDADIEWIKQQQGVA
jgi:exodeoxyribonuclease (lambda-induced)